MSLDAVLHADSEYTLCLAIWLRGRVEKMRKQVKIAENDAFRALGKMLITPERNTLASSAWFHFGEDVMGDRVQSKKLKS